MHAHIHARDLFEAICAWRLLLTMFRKLKKCHAFVAINAPLFLLVILSGKFIDKQ